MSPTRKQGGRPEGPLDDAEVLRETAELAGFFMAHAIWCVEDGETLIPMLAMDGNRMIRLDFERLDEAVEQGKSWIAENPDNVERAVLIYDGYVTRDSIRRDAIVCMAVEYGPPRRSFQVYQRYRHAEAEGGFAVFRPEFLIASVDDIAPTVEAFYRGVAAHEKGSAVWSRYLDETG